jgi:hypothetical protein
MSQVVSLYVIKEDLEWQNRVVLFAHSVAPDSAKVFLPGDEEELVRFLREDGFYTITDPDRAFDPEFWRHASGQPCGKLIEISYPRQKRGHKPKNRKTRNRNRQKYGRMGSGPVLYLRPVCVGVCKASGKACKPCKLGHGVQGCRCGT